MSTTKLVDSNRRTHAAKVLAEASKKNQHQEDHVMKANESITDKSNNSLNEQYRVIREDVLKLREDLAHGYDLLKEWIETKISRRTLTKSKS